MIKSHTPDRLSFFIVTLFYTATLLVGYFFIKGHTIVNTVEDSKKKKLVHVVLVQFKETIQSQELQKIIDAAYGLQAIPGVRTLNFSQNVSPEGLGKGYTHALSMKFDSSTDRDSIYLPHPIHQKFVELFVPFTESVLVYDFWE